METIRNYLESMFAQLPNTPEVWKAKDELLQMMEDKYNELLSDGASENEAVGRVIAEFGNLDEVAETLGISNIINNTQPRTGIELTMEEAKNYIADRATGAVRIGIAVLLFITCPVWPIIGDALQQAINPGHDFGSAIGACLLFIAIAIGVGICIYNGNLMKKWEMLKPGNYYINPDTAKYVYDENRNNQSNYALLRTVGIILIILCFVPAIIFDQFTHSDFIGELFSAPLLFIFIGLGVLLLIVAGNKEDSYKDVLSLNDRNTVAGNYVPRDNKNKTYANKTVDAIMSVYWPTVTCIYLIWSFITFSWGITWIIWPIAGIIHGLLNNIYGEEE